MRGRKASKALLDDAESMLMEIRAAAAEDLLRATTAAHRRSTAAEQAVGAATAAFAAATTAAAAARLGAAAGPLVAGIGVTAAGWRVLFYGTLAVIALLFVAAWRYLPDLNAERARSPHRFARLDLPGGLLLAAGCQRHRQL